MNWRLDTAQRRSIGFKWLEYEALKISTWLFFKAFSLTKWVWCTYRLSRKMYVFCFFMRVRRTLRKSTKSEVLIDKSLWSNATTLPWILIAATTAMHLKPIFAFSIFNEASPAFAQYLALIWLLVKQASSTKTMFARYPISLITWGSILHLVLFIAVSCAAVNCWLKRMTRSFT